jgi:hypothetical protein
VCILLVDDCEIACIFITYFVVTLQNNNVLVNTTFSAINGPHINLKVHISYTNLNFHLLINFSCKNLHYFAVHCFYL